MNQDTRQQIRDNAQYLRNVRPLDPEELHEYVEGQPHPAVVKQVLREEAFTLASRADDGTFVPHRRPGRLISTASSGRSTTPVSSTCYDWHSGVAQRRQR